MLLLEQWRQRQRRRPVVRKATVATDISNNTQNWRALENALLSKYTNLWIKGIRIVRGTNLGPSLRNF